MRVATIDIGTNSVLLLVGLSPDSQFYRLLRGQLLLSLVSFPAVVPIGTIPTGGELTVPFNVSDIAPGVSDLTLFIQSLFGMSDGKPILGSHQVLLILDPAY